MRGGASGLWHPKGPLKTRLATGCYRCDAALIRYLTIDSRNRVSNVFIPPLIQTRNKDTIDSANLLYDAGFVRKAAAGLYYLLPLGVRVQDKLSRLADEAMKRVGASKLELSSLSSAHLWRKSRRWETTGDELFKLEDRKGSKFCLAPTHEEDVTSLIATSLQSWRSLPLRVYQIGKKYRDEKRPRAGLLRGREFLMKDMYSFDTDEEAAMSTYGEVRDAYDWFFKQIGLPFVTVDAEGGNIGGSICHEYHYVSEAGEDTLYRCISCDYAKNAEVHKAEEDSRRCPKCEHATLEISSAIELGHTFYLGTKYSSIFNATYMPAHDPSALETVHMGCYGLGLSRMIATIAQVSHDKSGIMWPESVAPWNCVVIQGKSEGSEAVYDGIASILGVDNVILDDRPNSIGWKLLEAKRIGYPHIVVLGKKWEEAGKVEIINRRAGTTEHVESSVLLDPAYWKSVTSSYEI